MNLSTKFKKQLFKFKLIPSYSEDTLFLSALAFILLYTVSADLRIDFQNFTFSDFRGVLFAIFILSGLFFSIYHAFTIKPKTDTQKSMMLFFVVIANVWAGITSITHLLETSSGLLSIFPVWNLFNALLLFLLFRLDILNIKSIQDKNTNFLEILLGSAILISLFYFSHYTYGNHWSITFSITVGYATSINRFIKYLFNKSNILNLI